MFRLTKTSILASAFSAGLTFGPSAMAETFSFDFDSGLPAAFSGAGSVVSVAGLAGHNGFAGSMLWNGAAAAMASDLSLSGLASHDTVTISFSLGLLDSWDATNGSVSTAPDYFNVTADGIERFEASVANASGSIEIVPSSATNRTSGANLYGNYWTDTLFDVSFSFAHSGSDLALSFFADGRGWQGGSDESWSIDNLVVRTSGAAGGVVPLPAGLPLLVGALGTLGLLRRRRG
jgi:hypothetical protein